MKKNKKYFICISQHSLKLEYSMIYVYDPTIDVELENEISVQEYNHIQRNGSGHGGIVPKKDLLEITENEFKEFELIWNNENGLYNTVEFIYSMMEKYKVM